MNTLLGFYFLVYHPQIKCPYVLVTHNSDHPAPGPFSHYLDDPKIIKWFAQNVENFSHPKLVPIPIGIANSGWAHGKSETFFKVLECKDIIERSVCLYMNIATSTHPERVQVYDLFCKAPFCLTSLPKAHVDYLYDLLSAKFVISPRGNGLDCHRTWEALLMGAYPIVRSSSLDAMFADLPVVIINDWEEVTEEFLTLKYEEFRKKTFNLNKAYVRYWLDLIKSSRFNP